MSEFELDSSRRAQRALTNIKTEWRDDRRLHNPCAWPDPAEIAERNEPVILATISHENMSAELCKLVEDKRGSRRIRMSSALCA